MSLHPRFAQKRPRHDRAQPQEYVNQGSANRAVARTIEFRSKQRAQQRALHAFGVKEKIVENLSTKRQGPHAIEVSFSSGRVS